MPPDLTPITLSGLLIASRKSEATGMSLGQESSTLLREVTKKAGEIEFIRISFARKGSIKSRQSSSDGNKSTFPYFWTRKR